jgi:hypothetical protein
MASSERTTQRPFSRKGLHRIECECGHYLYTTVAAVETFGLPTCPCGRQFVPARRELATIIGATSAPCLVEFQTAKDLGMTDGQAEAWAEAKRRERVSARLAGLSGV